MKERRKKKREGVNEEEGEEMGEDRLPHLVAAGRESDERERNPNRENASSDIYWNAKVVEDLVYMWCVLAPHDQTPSDYYYVSSKLLL